jgi:Ca-activated chloride channel family protein
MIFRDKIYSVFFVIIFYLLIRAWQDFIVKKNYPKLLIPYSKIFVNSAKTNFLNFRFLHYLGYFSALSFFVLALLRPQTSQKITQRNVEGIDILMVLDLSASMNVEDFENSNRIDVAKKIMKEFISGRASDKIGLEVFSGEVVTLVPPTLDYDLVISALENAEIGMLKDGTAIGDAIATGVARLKESTTKSRIMILLTDGDSNVGQVDPLTAGELAKGYGIKIYSIAIGREGRVAMPFIQKNIFGQKVKTYQYFDSSINPELLMKISSMTNGKFYRVYGDEKVLRKVFQDIDQLERTKIEVKEQVRFNEHYQEYMKIGFILLLLTLILKQTILRAVP